MVVKGHRDCRQHNVLLPGFGSHGLSSGGAQRSPYRVQGADQREAQSGVGSDHHPAPSSF